MLTRAEAAALREAGLADYAHLKDTTLLTAAALVALGSAAAAAIGGPSIASPFAAGGAAGLVYGLALHRGVDAVGGAASPLARAFDAGGVARGAALLALAVGGAALLVTHAGGGGGGDGADGVAAALALSARGAARVAVLRELLAAAAGFSMYKVGLVATVAASEARGKGAKPSVARERVGAQPDDER